MSIEYKVGTNFEALLCKNTEINSRGLKQLNFKLHTI